MELQVVKVFEDAESENIRLRNANTLDVHSNM